MITILILATSYSIIMLFFAINAVGNADSIYEIGEEEYGLPRGHVTVVILFVVLLWPIAIIVAAIVTLYDKH